jgi:hypothetical protein
MSLEKFNPTIWSATLWKELEAKRYAIQNCNTDFEGEIRDVGDKVKINGIGPITIFDYTKNTNMSDPETLTDNERFLEITQAKAFNFQIDDIDKAQQKPKLIKDAMRMAAEALGQTSDSYIYGMYGASSNKIALDGSNNTMFKSANNNVVANEQITAATALAKLTAVRQKLTENNVPIDQDVALEMSPAVWAQIVQAQISIKTNNDRVTDRGYVGSFLGFDFYVSNNIQTKNETIGGSQVPVFQCYARTRRAVSYAEQINNVEAYRPEKRFADAAKGLHLYGAKLIYPKECVLIKWYV